MERRIKKFIDDRKKEDLLRSLSEVTYSARGGMVVDGKEYINFSSNDYLSLASHPKLKAAATGALKTCVGTSASRLMTGSTSLHHVLEEKISEFKGKPAALVFNSGYQANVGIISVLAGRGDCIFSDRLNHASIVDGARMSGAEVFRFRHNDTEHLEELVKKERPNHKGALIVTETVFSMDGDAAPLEEIVRIGKGNDCLLMVDEAHATGIFGAGGSGMAEEKKVTDDIDIIMGTFSKALGSFGAYAAVSPRMREYLVNACRSFIYSTSLPPSVIAASIAALEIVKDEPQRRETLTESARRFRENLTEKGFDTRGSSQIIPVITGENSRTVEMSRLLKKKGYWVTPVRPPTVPKGEARLRISLSFAHSRDVLDSFVDDLVEVNSDQ
ncbi:MAG: 8-amino-7-oxononanoate synthase [Candidatus Tantalella remota]|nr:8-amino-7-oxononanoate synthase [Candidatus Tantalella remota]